MLGAKFFLLYLVRKRFFFFHIEDVEAQRYAFSKALLKWFLIAIADLTSGSKDRFFLKNGGWTMEEQNFRSLELKRDGF